MSTFPQEDRLHSKLPTCDRFSVSTWLGHDTKTHNYTLLWMLYCGCVKMRLTFKSPDRVTRYLHVWVGLVQPAEDAQRKA